MRKNIMTLVVLLLLLSMLPISKAEAQVQFSDLHGYGATKEIMYLYDKHIISGYPDGTFRPNQPITRAQAAVMLLKALDIKVIDNPTAIFKDVSNTSNYYKILATINEKGIIRGDKGYMRPGEITTRAQMAAILRRAFNLPLDGQQAYRDVSSSHWAFSDINSIAKHRISGGYPDGTFKPSIAVTRAQFSTFLARALNDDMKLDSEKSIVIEKGTKIERDGWLYTIKNNNLVKISQKTKEEVILFSISDFPITDGYVEERLGNGFPIILHNDEIFIPYWGGVSIMTDRPVHYGLMKTSIEDGKYEEIYMEGVKKSNSIRNVYIWNNRIYYTSEQEQRYFDYIFDDTVNIDDPLFLYSANLDGSNAKRETPSTFDARVIFDNLKEINDHVQYGIANVTQNNKSIKFDDSTMYYFNEKGVFTYSLLDGKTKKLSTIQAKDMTVTDTGIVIEDVRGKKHTMKK
ncbi:S-layer homology domain-containing protein [Sporosarcina sp. ANT_H38]|uniref:S-layer homology domain-containing protein n=1 Tax=Sporosarcina sp. ANT_H38 TaxID=2597358 RepID=UPI0011F322ED|nr:S-layer homology domain-containing protein [Sporosarcina sp. ANT_H38]KAA0964866.1 S-layer homology domain-containing protein [Sporosarcina sp. ANT_H38]